MRARCGLLQVGLALLNNKDWTLRSRRMESEVMLGCVDLSCVKTLPT